MKSVLMVFAKTTSLFRTTEIPHGYVKERTQLQTLVPPNLQRRDK